ncbi:MAG: hypothetical protein AAF594_03365 [Bacteroidota bacterium]
MRAAVEALCEGDAACAAAVRDRVQERCGTDRACARQALEHARAERDGTGGSLSDLPPSVQRLVGELVDLAAERSASESASETETAALGPEASAQLQALPERLQNRIRTRCGTDPDCIREAMEEARARRDRRAGGRASDEADPDDATPEAGGGGTGRALPGRTGGPLDNPSQGLGSRGAADEADPEVGTPGSRGGLRGDGPPRGRPGTVVPGDSDEEETGGARVLEGTFERPGGGNVGIGVRPERTTPEADAGDGAEAEPTFSHGQGSLAGVSGSRQRAGMLMTPLRVPDGHWVYAIEMGERADVPCWLALWSFGPDDAPEATHVFDECDGDAPTARSLHVAAFHRAETPAEVEAANYVQVSLGGTNLTTMTVEAARGLASLFDNSTAATPLPVLASGEPYALSRLAICQNSGSLRMKGLRVFGVTLDASGPRVATESIMATVQGIESLATETFERPNCTDWQETRACPNGQVLVGLNVQHGEAPGDRRQVMGLSPYCAPIDVER